MNKLEFLNKIVNLFPCSDDENIIEDRINMYSSLLSDIETKEKREIAYDKTLNDFVKNYPYKGFPNFTEISKCIKFSPESYMEIDKPKKYLVKAYGHYYEFEQVPSSWKGVHSISDFSEVYEIEWFSDNILVILLQKFTHFLTNLHGHGFYVTVR